MKNIKGIFHPSGTLWIGKFRSPKDGEAKFVGSFGNVSPMNSMLYRITGENRWTSGFSTLSGWIFQASMLEYCFWDAFESWRSGLCSKNRTNWSISSPEGRRSWLNNCRNELTLIVSRIPHWTSNKFRSVVSIMSPSRSHSLKRL